MRHLIVSFRAQRAPANQCSLKGEAISPLCGGVAAGAREINDWRGRILLAIEPERSAISSTLSSAERILRRTRTRRTD